MAFPPFLVKQLYCCDSVVISSFVRTGCTTRRWGWLLGRIGYSITRHYPLICETRTGQQMAHLHERLLKNERPTWCHLLFYFTSYVLNMFRTLIYPSSAACDCVVELPHRSSCSQFVVCWRFGAAGFEWCSFCRLQPAKRAPLKTLLYIYHEKEFRHLHATPQPATLL